MDRESLPILSSPPSETAPNTAAAATTLAPGFRFHPTDEELVRYYLKRKVLNKPILFDAIGDVDIYKHEPWDLAVFSRLKSRDQEWYFFSRLDKKNGSNVRMNRATNKGYWKATGKDREIRSEIVLLGMKKSLVYHTGRAPDGLRTNWVMHEYRLVEFETENLQEDAYVLCKVFLKNNIGPSDGKIYAPFIEEEWIDDDNGVMALIPGVESLPIDNVNNQMDLQNHHENSLKLQMDNNSNDHDEQKEALKREHPSPLPRLQYKRRRQNKSNNNSSKTTEALTSSCSDAADINSAISTLLEISVLMGSSENLETHTPPSKEVSSPPPPLSTEEKIQQMSIERESFKVEMNEARDKINILMSRIDSLSQENNELKEKNIK